MANYSSSCGLFSSSTSIHTNSPSFQHFSPDFDSITKRIPSFGDGFNVPEFLQLVSRVDGTNREAIKVLDLDSKDSPNSNPPNNSKFANLVASPILIREKMKNGDKNGAKSEVCSKIEDMSDFVKNFEPNSSSNDQGLPLCSNISDFPILSREQLNHGGKNGGKFVHPPLKGSLEGLEKKMTTTKAGNQVDFFPSKADLADLGGDSFPKVNRGDDLFPSKADSANLKGDLLPNKDIGADCNFHKPNLADLVVNDLPKVELVDANTKKNENMADLNSNPSPRIRSDPEHIYFGNIKVSTNGKSDELHSFSNSTRKTLKYIKPEIINGEVFVKPTWEVARIGMKRWENTIVGYFLGKRISFMAVKNFTMSIWRGLIEVKATSNGFFFFKFDSEIQMMNVLEGGPWLFAGQPLFLERWKEGMSLEKRNHQEVPIWVKFRNLPTEYWTSEGLSMVASSVGRPLYPDAFTSSMERLDYARVCVVVDIHSKFKDHVFMLLPSDSGEYNGTRKVFIEYEWKPALCTLCTTFGHKEGDCRLAKKVVQKPKPVHIYVQKNNAIDQRANSDAWKVVTRKQAKDKIKGLNEAAECMVNEILASPTKTMREDNELLTKKKEIVDRNPFALLEGNDMEEEMDTMAGRLLRGPMKTTTPLEVNK